MHFVVTVDAIRTFHILCIPCKDGKISMCGIRCNTFWLKMIWLYLAHHWALANSNTISINHEHTHTFRPSMCACGFVSSVIMYWEGIVRKLINLVNKEMHPLQMFMCRSNVSLTYCKIVAAIDTQEHEIAFLYTHL